MSDLDTLTAIMKAANFAAIKHKKQKRKDLEETPYINHPIGVAYILLEEGKISDPDVLQAALLHDTVEDTETTLPELEEHFGPKVAKIVAEVTDDKNLPKEERKRLQIVHSAKSSTEAKLVKLADKLYNLRDLQRATPVGWSPERIQEYFVWAAQVVKGLSGTNAALEAQLVEVFRSKGVTV